MPPDPGLAVERTALSWRRTAMSAMTATAVFAHAAASTRATVTAAAALAAVAALVVVTVYCSRRNAALRSRRRGDITVATAFVSAVVAVVAVAAAVIGLTW